MPGQSRNFLRDRKLVSESCCLPVDIVVRRFVVVAGKDVPVVVDASGRLVHPVRVGAAMGGGRRRGRGGRGGGEIFGGGLSCV